MKLRALAVAFTLAVVATAWPALTPAAEATPTCDGVWVVVDTGDLGGGTSTRCASFASGAYPVTGQQVLQTAGHSLTFVGSTGFLCRIDGAPSSDSCARTPPANAYWSYWVADAGGSWRFSSQGATTSRRQAGQVDGWVFGDGSRAPRVAPPAAPPPPPPPEPEPEPEPEPAPEPAPSNGGSSSGSGGSSGSSSSSGSGSSGGSGSSSGSSTTGGGGSSADDSGAGASTTEGADPDDAASETTTSDDAEESPDGDPPDDGQDPADDPSDDGPEDDSDADEEPQDDGSDDTSEASEPEPEEDTTSEALDADAAAADDGRSPLGLLLGVLLIAGLVGLGVFEARRRRAGG